jgi:tetratricopeptide (TPR) repeat protein
MAASLQSPQSIVIRALPPLIAYREDLERHPGRETFGEFDGVWIALAHVLEFMSGLEPEERPDVAMNFGRGLVEMLSEELEREGGPSRTSETLTDLAAELTGERDETLDERLAAACLAVIEEMTDTGADLLSFTALLHTRLAFEGTSRRLLGRILSHQGRVARQYGDLGTAQDFFDAVVGLARETRDPDIESRGRYGAAGIALMRGNHPAARELYEASLAAATSAHSEELIGLAHRGLMVIEASANDFDASIQHAAEALRRAPARVTSQAELLGNIAGVAAAVGHHEAALAAYMAAARLDAALRVMLACLGGAAVSAAHLDRRNVLRELDRRIVSQIESGAPPYESGQVLLDLAGAYEVCSDPRAVTCARRVRELATEHQFFEMQYAADELLARVAGASSSAPPPAHPPVSESSRAVLDSIARLAEDDCDDRLVALTRG